MDDHMDGHGEQPGPNPGGGAGRSENLQGRGPEEGTEHTGVTFLSLICEKNPHLEVGAGGVPLARCAAHTPDRVPIV